MAVIIHATVVAESKITTREKIRDTSAPVLATRNDKMVSKKKAVELLNACLDEMYRASTPPITWEECQTEYKNVDEWYMKHVISTEDYTRIHDKYVKQLGRRWSGDLEMTLLSYSPTEEIKQ